MPRSLLISALLAALRFPLFLFAAILPKYKKIWVFGAWFGRSYSDNPVYLFEHVSRTQPDIHACWLSRDEKVLASLRARGLRAERISSFRGWWVCARARVAFMGSGLEDINRYAVGPRTLLVQLWHGTPLKRIKNDAELGGLKHRLRTKLGVDPARLLRLFPFLGEAQDVTLSPSPRVTHRLATAFGLPENRVLPLGVPRADVLFGEFQPILPPRIPEEMRAPSRLRILFCPTFRQFGQGGYDHFGGFDATQAETLLASLNATLFLKLHPRDFTRQPAFDAAHIRPLSPADYPDINHLLPHTDILITDYSSTFFDYALLERPILFLAPDLETYQTQDRGFYEDYESFVPGPIFRSWTALLDWFETHGPTLREGSKRHEVFNQKYNTYNTPGACQRITDWTLRQVGLTVSGTEGT